MMKTKEERKKDYCMGVANEIYSQLLATAGASVVFSWGIHAMRATWYLDNPALVMKVSARLFSGYVVVALSPADYYNIYLMDEDGDISTLRTDAGCEEVSSIIDRKIETGDDPAIYREFCDKVRRDLFSGKINLN